MTDYAYIKQGPQLTVDERERMKRNDERFATLSLSEQFEVLNAMKLYFADNFISGEHYTPEAFKDLVEYYGEKPMRMRAIDAAESRRSSGWVDWAIPGTASWEPSRVPPVTPPDPESRMLRGQLVLKQRRKREFKQMTCPWEFMRPLMSKKKRAELDLAIDDLRLDARELHDAGWAKGKLRLYFVYHSTLIYRDVLWACLRAAFAAGWILGKFR